MDYGKLLLIGMVVAFLVGALIGVVIQRRNGG